MTDFLRSLRSFLAHPGPLAVALVALTLGIGATTAIFSVVNTVLWRPYPYPEADRLFLAWIANPARNVPEERVSPADLRDWMAWTRTAEFAAYRPESLTLTNVDLPERVEALSVTPSLLTLLGARTSAGQIFRAEDGQPGRNDVVVLSHALWQRRFAGDPQITGRTLTLSGKSYRVAGVLAPDFQLLDTEFDVLRAFAFDETELAQRGFRTLRILGRRAPDASLEQLRQDLNATSARLAQEHPDFNKGWEIRAASLPEKLAGDVRPTLFTLFGAVCGVLLVTCANVASLLVARAASRQKEMAVRASLGATPAAILKQVLLESLALGLTGGVLGLILAWAALRALTIWGPDTLPRRADLSLDWMAFVFAVALAVVTSLIFGLGPAITASRTDIQSILRAAGRSGMSTRGRRWFRSALIVVEVALSVMLVIGSLLLVRSLMRLQGVDLGFRTERVLTLRLSLPEKRYPGLEAVRFLERLEDRMRQLPGVESFGITRDVPLTGRNGNPRLNYTIEGRPKVASTDQPRARYRLAGGGYFETLGLRLIDGRYLQSSDRADAPPVIVINEALARQQFAGQNPIGQRIKSGFPSSPWYQIVGVVGNTRHLSLEEEPGPETYVPYAQVPADQINFVAETMTLAVRTASDPTAMANTIRSEVRTLDADLAVFQVRPLRALVDRGLAQPRFRTGLLSAFAMAALLLAAIGLFGLLSHSVAQRTNEFGIRLALGESLSQLLMRVVNEGLGLTLAGVILGVAGAFALARLIANLLFGVPAFDAVSFVVAPLILLLVALLASLGPAWRAGRVDPVQALRAE